MNMNQQAKANMVYLKISSWKMMKRMHQQA
jgi:hypothetical protein